MPLVVRLELRKASTGEVVELGQMEIANTGGVPETGEYQVTLSGGRGGRRHTGWVLGHKRLTEPAWLLVAKALQSVGFGNAGALFGEESALHEALTYCEQAQDAAKEKDWTEVVHALGHVRCALFKALGRKP